mgnify:CR=1 FL=1
MSRELRRLDARRTRTEADLSAVAGVLWLAAAALAICCLALAPAAWVLGMSLWLPGAAGLASGLCWASGLACSTVPVYREVGL